MGSTRRARIAEAAVAPRRSPLTERRSAMARPRTDVRIVALYQAHALALQRYLRRMTLLE
jgi:hypothetical protein